MVDDQLIVVEVVIAFMFLFISNRRAGVNKVFWVGSDDAHHVFVEANDLCHRPVALEHVFTQANNANIAFDISARVIHSIEACGIVRPLSAMIIKFYTRKRTVRWTNDILNIDIEIPTKHPSALFSLA